MGVEYKMGRIEEIENLEDNIDEPEKLKEAGNDAFKRGNYDDALECYTKAIRKTKDTFEKQKAVYYKNRAACHLKMENYDDAVFDCNKSLELVPKDPKALFRRCQAYEGLDKIDAAYTDAKEVHNLDPKNKALEPILVRLHKGVQAKLGELAQTANKVKSMFDIVFNIEGDTEKREKAADNLIVLAREKAGAELLQGQGLLPCQHWLGATQQPGHFILNNKTQVFGTKLQDNQRSVGNLALQKIIFI